VPAFTVFYREWYEKQACSSVNEAFEAMNEAIHYF
jgi:hypothetical protein